MKIIIKIALIITLISTSTISFAKSFADREEVQEFIEHMVTKHKFNKQNLNDIFASVDSSEDIIRLISKPYETLDWGRYRKLFITKDRIKKGVKFWQAHEAILEKLEKQYKVPAEIIVSIVGVETFYGKNKGSYPVVQALSTIAFDYPKRATYFRKELEQFLLMTKEQNLDPRSVTGSYAGAMGIPQFMPSSYRNFAVNHTGTGSVDIINSNDSALASVANYLRKNGWKDEKDKINQAIITGNKYKSFITEKLVRPKHTLEILNRNGVLASKKLQKSDKLSLITLEADNNNEYWLVDNNFYTITTYNRSFNYAMAVYQLSQEIKKAKHNENKTTM